MQHLYVERSEHDGAAVHAQDVCRVYEHHDAWQNAARALLFVLQATHDRGRVGVRWFSARGPEAAVGLFRR